jgi:hypothetical protein
MMTTTTPVTEHSITGPTHAFDDDSVRTYVHPITDERFTSVTTALGIIDKKALNPWYAKMATLHMLGQLPKINAAASAGRVSCQRSGCGQCLMCLISAARKAPERERDAAANRGVRLHDVAQWYGLTGEIIPHDDDIAGHVRNFLEFVRVHEVTFLATEVTVLNRTHGWGGTLDTQIVCGWMPPKHVDLIGVPLLADYKTSNGVYGTTGLQLAGYNNAESILLDGGAELPPLVSHPDVALSIQIRADGWWVRPCPTDEQAYAVFLRALQLWRDMNESDIEYVGRAMYKPRDPAQKKPPAAPKKKPSVKKEA